MKDVAINLHVSSQLMNALPQVSEVQRRQTAGQGATKPDIQGVRRAAVSEKKKASSRV